MGKKAIEPKVVEKKKKKVTEAPEPKAKDAKKEPANPPVKKKAISK